MTVRVGVTVPNAHESLAEPATIADVAQAAERLGFASLWVNDHVVTPGGPASTEPGYAARYGEQRGQSIYEPLITLAYLAGTTERIALGTSVYLLPLRHPLLSAKQVVSLDALSGGRVIFGIGVGWLPGEFDAVGVPFGERGARTNEALRRLKALCAEERAEFLPKPAQDPHPPVWVGGRSEAAMRRAARLGDAWHPSHLTLDELRAQVPKLRQACEEAGRAPGDVAVTTRRRVIRHGDAEAAEADRVLAGGPEGIAATMAELEEAGVSHLVVEIPGDTREELLENLEWFDSEVLRA
jgi:probable F420-dependent oxidoreductase